MSLLGVDVGTTGCKAVAFDLEGRELARAHREYPEIYPRPNWVEMDPDLIWAAVKEVISAVTAKTRRDPVEAVSFSVLGEAVTPISKTGRALHNSVTSVDNRALSQTQWWETSLGRKRLFSITGMPLHPSYSLNKILWFRDERPKVFARTWKFLCYSDLMVYRLCGEPAIDYSLAGRTMAFDIRKKKWSEEVLGAAGIDPSLLPPALPAGTVVGTVRKSVADELGLSPTTAVVTGGHDQPVSALGAGLVHPDMGSLCSGSVDCITATFARPVLTQKMLRSNYPVYPHVVPGLYITIAYHYCAGSLLQWFRNRFCAEEMRRAQREKKNPYDLILDGIPAQPTTVLWLPHFVGAAIPYLDPLSNGAIIGLRLSDDKKSLARSLLESVAYETRINRDTLAEAGIRFGGFRAFGGGARSDLWLQIKADVLGVPMTRMQIEEAGSLGAALLAGTAIGRYVSLQEAAKEVIRPARTFVPNPRRASRYEDIYQVYRRLYGTLRPLNHALSQLAQIS